MDFLKSVKDLDLYLLNTRTPKNSEVSLVESAFELWKKEWEKTFDSISVNYGKKLNSDDFLSRDVFALFDGNKPVGLFFNSWFKFKKSHLSHSYFNNYPEDVLSTLESKNINNFMTLSYMTIDREWTKSYTDFPISEVLFSIGVKYFKESNFDYLVGYIRTDRGDFHKVFNRHGGKLLTRSNAYNVGVNFLYLTQQNAKISTKDGVNKVTDFLWKKYLLKTSTKQKQENYELFR